MIKNRKISPDNVHFWWVGENETQDIIKALGKGNCQFVGGAVRDSLLGKAVLDVDVATPLMPEQAISALRKVGIKVIPTGLEHGTITACIKDKTFEITTLRHDVKTYGRHADVAFHADWQADAARRDFTINALYLDPDKMLYDYFDGEKDLNDGLVRFIGDAENRIKEDGLRILRFFRFHAWYGKGDLNKKGLGAVANTLGRLDKLSAERVCAEFLKILRALDPLPVLKEMKEGGVLDHVFASTTFNFEKLARLVQLESGLGQVSPLRRLVALAVTDEAGAKSIGKQLKLSNKQQTRAIAMAMGDLTNLSEKAAAREIYALGKETFIDRLLLSGGKASIIKSLLKFAKDYQVPKFPVGGADLEKIGIKPGPTMGKILKDLEGKWLDSGFKLTKEALLKDVS